jgi:transcriptional regulator with XRE-family HTH domain
MPINDLGYIIRHRRSILRLSQMELSDISGVTLRTIREIETGVGNPSYYTLEKITDVLGLEITVRIKSPLKDESTGI